jgi:predicted transcriptional regulator
MIMNEDEKFQEIIQSLSNKGLITTKNEIIYCTKKGLYRYFESLFETYKKDEQDFKII